MIARGVAALLTLAALIGVTTSAWGQSPDLFLSAPPTRAPFPKVPASPLIPTPAPAPTPRKAPESAAVPRQLEAARKAEEDAAQKAAADREATERAARERREQSKIERKPYGGDVAAVPRSAQCSSRLDRANDTSLFRTANIKISNDGGWCWYQTTFYYYSQISSSGKISQAPAHGEAVIGTVGDRTKFAYRPSPGFVGQDKFSVKVTSGALNIDVTVDVTAP